MRITAVDPQVPAVAALLMYLQLTALPHDVPIDVTSPSSGYWWVAYDGDHPVAFASLCQSHQWADTGYLSRAGVLPSHRGLGLQKRLIRVRERKARKLGWNWLVTDTTGNPPSTNNLIDCGFRTFQPSKPWGMEAALYWKKKLNAT